MRLDTGGLIGATVDLDTALTLAENQTICPIRVGRFDPPGRVRSSEAHLKTSSCAPALRHGNRAEARPSIGKTAEQRRTVDTTTGAVSEHRGQDMSVNRWHRNPQDAPPGLTVQRRLARLYVHLCNYCTSTYIR
jgi:hypothetical protein